MVLAVRTVLPADIRTQVRPAHCAHQDKRRTRSPRLMAVCGALQTRSVCLGKSVSAAMLILWLMTTAQLAFARSARTTQLVLQKATPCSVSVIDMFRQKIETRHHCAFLAAVCRVLTAVLESRRSKKAMPWQAMIRSDRAVHGYCLNARCQKRAFISLGRSAG